jgi:hypothetical protein
MYSVFNDSVWTVHLSHDGEKTTRRGERDKDR